MVLSSASPAGVQDISAVVNNLMDTVGYLNTLAEGINELRSMLTIDPSGRLRVLIDNITAALTLATITTVGTVTTVTTATDVTRINNMGTAAFNVFAGYMPVNMMNLNVADAIRVNISTT